MIQVLAQAQIAMPPRKGERKSKPPPGAARLVRTLDDLIPDDCRCSSWASFLPPPVAPPVSTRSSNVSGSASSSNLPVVAHVPLTRHDKPVLLPSKRASKELALSATHSATNRVQAIEEYRRDKSAASAAGPRQSLTNTWVEFHTAWFKNDEWLPLTPLRIEAVAAVFEKGGCRSYPNYLSKAKETHINAGHVWSSALELEARKSSMSTLRGIGPPRQSAPFGVQLLWNLETVYPSACGPLRFRDAMVVACFWLLREVELAHLMYIDVSVNTLRLTVSLRLSVSKTDPRALGCTRTWGCVCNGDRGKVCPYHSVIDAVEALRVRHADDEAALRASSLFPDCQGAVCTKEGVVQSLEVWVAASGQPIVTPDGDRR